MKRFIAVVLFLTLLPLFGYAQNSDDQYKEGLVAYKAKDWDSAVSIMNQVVQGDPSNWQAYQILSYSYFKKKDFEDSFQTSKESLKLNPDNPTLQKFVDRLKVKLSKTSDTGSSQKLQALPLLLLRVRKPNLNQPARPVAPQPRSIHLLKKLHQLLHRPKPRLMLLNP